MAQVEAATSNDHVVIRIDDDDEDEASMSCCAVCMEPSEWVIVGACGHQDVCLYCGVRLRFFQDDRRCCICRAFCATVVVIPRADTNSRPQEVEVVDDNESSQASSQSAVFSETSPAFGGVIRPAGTTYCWYHGGMAAYFDDRAPYEAVRNMCSKHLHPPTGVGNDGGAPYQDHPNTELKSFLLYLAVMTLGGAAASFPVAMYIKHWLPRVALVIGGGLVAAVLTCFDARNH